ncbi:UDP-N-acetylmuramoyl-L-alanine--D-glutamate ligase [Polycladidibacter hongkongensis]|uniref:UDP-N-acetylmuramoyl-L-alanine--D-glutamate ligase n=1 Tax=Polycladidibacter hongkongensis TaxID=1647556 RepID=UPI00082E6543|nr:UDP-N-acetylmuramoyl-L-alanine--D-glutamate ligase [Pseudovibrio hongkongensis]
MIALSVFSGKEVALFGLGGSGVATAKALEAGGARVDAFDDNAARCEAAEAAGLCVLDLREADFSRYAALVLAPGVPLTHPQPHWSVVKAQAAGVEIIGDMELFQRQLNATCPDALVVAITGTNGKSTSTALAAHMLTEVGFDVQMGGNIGRPVLDLAPLSGDRVYVLELSSYQIDLAPSFAPDVGVLLNLSPDHLDRHGTMEHYAAVKTRLVRASRLAVIGSDDEMSRQIGQQLEAGGGVVEYISGEQPVVAGVYLNESKLLEVFEGEEQEIADLAGAQALRGKHNGQNAAAAAVIGAALGVDAQEIARGLCSFEGLAHRAQVVAVADHVLFVNDSKATNAEAASHALESFDRIFWIAGGLPKEGGIDDLARFFPKIARAYLIGEAAEAFAQRLEGHAPYLILGSLESAVAAAAEDAHKDRSREAVVLLSPACASFDQFDSFEKRGEAFTAFAQAAAARLCDGGVS